MQRLVIAEQMIGKCVCASISFLCPLAPPWVPQDGDAPHEKKETTKKTKKQTEEMKEETPLGFEESSN